MHKTNYSKGGIYSTFQQAQGQLSLLYYFILKSVKKKRAAIKLLSPFPQKNKSKNKKTKIMKIKKLPLTGIFL